MGESYLLFREELTKPPRLTQGEEKVLFWLGQGKTTDEIATILGTRSKTVKKHLENIYPKLGGRTVLRQPYGLGMCFRIFRASCSGDEKVHSSARSA